MHSSLILSLFSSYIEAHRTIREITGYGKGFGPFVAIDYGDEGYEVFNGSMNGADRVVIERYYAAAVYSGDEMLDPVATGMVRKFCALGAEVDRR